MTDDGYVLDDLEQSGCKIDGGKRQDLLSAFRSYDVQPVPWSNRAATRQELAA